MIEAGLRAHGLGGSTDLPIPLDYAIVGAAWALTISFGVLALAWKEPRFTERETNAAAEVPRKPWLMALGLMVTGWILLALFAGPTGTENAGLPAVYVLVWVGLVPLALVFGWVWRDLSPWRTIQHWVGRASGRPDGFIAYPARLGYWPAVVGLFAFVWLELASPDPGSTNAVRIWVGAYAATMLIGGIAFGPRWYDRADPFDVYSAIVAKMSPLRLYGRWQVHNPFRTLPSIPVDRGLVAFLAVLLGSTAFDSFTAGDFWEARSPGNTTHALVLLAFPIVVGLLFWAASRATLGLDTTQRSQLPGLLAHSLVPIVVGYIVAHYLTLLVEKGQSAIIALGDPLNRGWDPFGDATATTWLSENPSTLAFIKVGAVIAGHVIAVIAAHDRALQVLPKAHRLTGQLAMLILMVGYTFTGLYLLFSV